MVIEVDVTHGDIIDADTIPYLGHTLSIDGGETATAVCHECGESHSMDIADERRFWIAILYLIGKFDECDGDAASEVAGKIEAVINSNAGKVATDRNLRKLEEKIKAELGYDIPIELHAP